MGTGTRRRKYAASTNIWTPDTDFTFKALSTGIEIPEDSCNSKN